MINAQDLELKDMTVSTNETFTTENSIIAGPNFTIAGTGTATFKAGDMIAIKSGFVVVENGQFFALTDVSTSIDQRVDIDLPHEFNLEQNYPNPFNPSTTIKYTLARKTQVKIAVYDITGRHIKTLVNKNQQAGLNKVEWNSKNQDGNDVVSGMYFYRITAENFTQTCKMILMR